MSRSIAGREGVEPDSRENNNKYQRDVHTLTKNTESDEYLPTTVSLLLYYSPTLNLPGQAGRLGDTDRYVFPQQL